MGAGIAQLCVQAGFNTLLFDLNPATLERAQQSIEAGLGKLVEKGKLTAEQRAEALSRLSPVSDLVMVQAELIIEAVVEKMAVKHQLFQELAAFNGPTTILASNTSTFPITQLAAPVPHPERVVGLHFFNPAPLMPLVEVISGVATAPEVTATVRQLAETHTGRQIPDDTAQRGDRSYLSHAENYALGACACKRCQLSGQRVVSSCCTPSTRSSASASAAGVPAAAE